MNKWEDEGDYLTQRYVTHDKKPMRVIISVRKDAILANESESPNHGKRGHKSGA